MTATTSAPAAFKRLFDDASQFPPGNLALGEAIDAHARWRRDRRAALVGRFLTPAGGIRELVRGLADNGEGWELGIVVPADGGADAADGAAEALAATSAVVSSVETPFAAGASMIERWRRAFPAAELYLEGSAPDLKVISALGAGAKLRCGGLRADAIPAVPAVADFVRGCAKANLPFKATAGLHQPLRHRSLALGAMEHGFLNVLVATGLSIGGADAAEVTRALLAADRASLGSGAGDLAAGRRLFRAFGTCSISEPIDGLRTLELLDD